MEAKTPKSIAAGTTKTPVTATIGLAGTPTEFVKMIDRHMPPMEKGADGQTDEATFTWKDGYGYTWTVTVTNG